MSRRLLFSDLYQPARIGTECDGCHVRDADWTAASDFEGEWYYCNSCARAIHRRELRRDAARRASA